MKRFSEFMESCTTADVNQGNTLKMGVTNHLTPVNNIVTNIRNLFSTLPVVAAVGEDGVSVKLNSSKFVNKEEINKVLYEPVYQSTSLYSYIVSQGLDLVKMIQIGMYWIVYFSPRDIKFAAPGLEPNPAAPCDEQKENEVEMFNFLITESDDDEELKDLTKEKINEIINSKDKVKAAKQLELLISAEMELPREYYFAGVKDKQGDESIALRWKHTIKRHKGLTGEVTRSLINIYEFSKDGVWVPDFDKDSLIQLPDEVKKLIESVLEFIGAKKTNDPCVWSLEESESDDDKDKDKDKDQDSDKDNDQDKDKDKDNDLLGDDNKDKDKDKDDVEDDKSREENDLL